MASLENTFNLDQNDNAVNLDQNDNTDKFLRNIIKTISSPLEIAQKIQNKKLHLNAIHKRVTVIINNFKESLDVKVILAYNKNIKSIFNYYRFLMLFFF